MSTFITRVELHKATFQDYETLHLYMKELKFFKVIQDLKSGLWYHLPLAEYQSQGTLSIADVCTLAKQAANKTGKTSSILVSQTVSITWEDLPTV